jgi:hypothetical protein
MRPGEVLREEFLTPLKTSGRSCRVCALPDPESSGSPANRPALHCAFGLPGRSAQRRGCNLQADYDVLIAKRS